MSALLGVRVPSCQHRWMSGCRRVGTVQCQGVAVSASPDVWMLQCRHCTLSGCRHDIRVLLSWVNYLSTGHFTRMSKVLLSPYFVHGILHCVLIGVVDCWWTVCRPRSLLNGMNQFLESLSITFRRDPNNFRPRINKLNSVKVSCSSHITLLPPPLYVCLHTCCLYVCVLVFRISIESMCVCVIHIVHMTRCMSMQ